MVQPPTHLGDFEVGRELGRGGMGVVYEAVQTSLGRRVALKVLGPGLGLTPRAVDRFRREASAAARLHHTNVVPVYATGEHAGTHFYAMELIDGPSLDAVIRQLRAQANQPVPAVAPDLTATHAYVPPDPLAASSPAGSGGSSADRFDRVAAMVADVADALEHAHRHGVTHRDVKPSNLLLAPDGRLSVTDFGLARLLEEPGVTVTGEFVGTPAYMSPEQITAGRIPVDHRTDVYSLGATLYELLALRPPFSADGRDRLLAMVIQKEPTSPRGIDPKVPRDLETICLKCLEKDPDRRYATAGGLAEDLRRYVNRFAISARRAGPLTKAGKWVRRNPWVAGLAAAVLVAVGAAGAIAWRADAERRQRDAEQLKRDAEAMAEKRQAAMEKAILAAMSGRMADADTALMEAERLGADLAERRFAAGMLAYYRGEYTTARRLLLEACDERPDWLTPRAFLTVVCIYIDDFEVADRSGDLAMRMTPVTAEDHLFRGWMIGIYNPRRALPDLDEAAKISRSVLTQVVRAEVLSTLADDNGRVEDAIAGRDALRAVRAVIGSPRFLSDQSLVHAAIGCNNCRLHGKDDEARAWLTDAEADFQDATAVADPDLLAGRSWYLLLRDGSDDALDAETSSAGLQRPDLACRYTHMAHLLRRNQTAEGLAYLAGAKPGKVDPFLRIAMLAGGDRVALQAEYRRGLSQASNSPYFPYRVVTASLAGLPDDARGEAQAFCEHHPPLAVYDEVPAFVRRAASHAYLGTPMDVEAEAGPSRYKRMLAYDTLAFAALGRGDRATAKSWFEKANHYPPMFGQNRNWMREIRRRVIGDPTWPAWLAEKK